MIAVDEHVKTLTPTTSRDSNPFSSAEALLNYERSKKKAAVDLYGKAGPHTCLTRSRPRQGRLCKENVELPKTNRVRTSGVNTGDGDSSMSFWFLR